MDDALRDSLKRVVGVHLEQAIEWKRQNPHSSACQQAWTDQYRIRNELLDGHGVMTVTPQEDLPAPDWDKGE